MRVILALLAACAWTLVSTRYVHAAAPDDSNLCQQATAAAEQLSGVPNQLLDAISRVESGRYDGADGALRAWPWTINEEGRGHFYASKSEAVAAAREFRARGIQSIDVGCTQINLMYHPNAFSSLEDAFDPARNAAFAASFLTDLFHQVGSWPHAAAAYHSQTPELGTDYQRKVLEAWADPINGSGEAPRNHPPAPRLADFHRQPASPPVNPPLSNVSLTSNQAIARPLNVPLGGFGHIIRMGGTPMVFNGRTLSGYRAMPVAMLTVQHRFSRY